jgi:Terpene synthase family 2, C-terminal metal binding
VPQDIDYDIPFPSLISPDAEAATAVHLDWVTRLGLLPATAARESYIAWDVGAGGARTYPHARGADLVLGVDMLGVCALFDDSFDEADSQERKGAARDVLMGPHGPDGSAAARSPILDASADVWHRTTNTMSSPWQARVAGHGQRAITAMVDEADLYRRKAVPNFDAAIQLQGHLATAGGVQLDLVERIGHYELPHEFFHLPGIQAIFDNCQRIAGICNNAVSLEKEEACGQYLNLVLLLETQRGLSRPQALAETQVMVRELSQEILRLRAVALAQCRHLGASPDQEESTQRYINDLCIFVRGYVDWFMTSGRYAARSRDPATPRRPRTRLQ